jgi:hypothetical protein
MEVNFFSGFLQGKSGKIDTGAAEMNTEEKKRKFA